MPSYSQFIGDHPRLQINPQCIGDHRRLSRLSQFVCYHLFSGPSRNKLAIIPLEESANLLSIIPVTKTTFNPLAIIPESQSTLNVFAIIPLEELLAINWQSSLQQNLPIYWRSSPFAELLSIYWRSSPLAELLSIYWQSFFRRICQFIVNHLR